MSPILSVLICFSRIEDEILRKVRGIVILPL
jgi:hypothetical protein